MDEAQLKYATTEEELLAIVYALEKLRSYLLGSKVIVFTDHTALKQLLVKKDLQDEGDILPIDDSFPYDALMAIATGENPWYDDYGSYIVGNLLPPDLRCILPWETKAILETCHSSAYGGHHGPSRTVAKVLQSGFFWPIMFHDSKVFVSACDACQRTGNITRRHEMPEVGILESRFLISGASIIKAYFCLPRETGLSY
ncbi:uncharacterized protein LOC141651355 [Silene latifolia]|uniref:uncharacterized protein LOC141651355 n=1 Tax=Silene latifolia TaxID=37657 RepID=UPI003D781B54